MMFNQIIPNISQTFVKVTLTIIDLPWTLKWIAVLLSFFAPLKDGVHFLALLVLVDIAFSIYFQVKVEFRKSRLKNKSIITKSEKFRLINTTIVLSKFYVSVEKLMVYVIMLGIFFGFDIIILKTNPSEVDGYRFTMTNAVLLILAIAEAKSIIGHAGEITSNKVFRKVGDLLEDIEKEKIKTNDGGSEG